MASAIEISVLCRDLHHACMYSGLIERRSGYSREYKRGTVRSTKCLARYGVTAS